MAPHRPGLVLLATWLGLWAAGGAAAPQIGYAYPAGGAQGTTFTVEVGGQYLRSAIGVRVSGAGVQAEVREYARALNNQEMRDTERFLRDLVMRRWCVRVMDEAAKDKDEPPLPDHPWLRDLDDIGLNDLNQLRARLFDPRIQPNAQIAEKLTVEVTVAPDAPPGDRELRILASDGLSNPICFQVGMLPELQERDFAGGEAGQVVQPPILLNGQIMPGEVDRIRLQARKGQKLTVRMQARKLIPYLADAVPGWFQATMSLHDPNGKEVAWSDDFQFDPDPAFLYEVPTDGVYELRVRDAIYRGRDDFVYRIAVGQLPMVTRCSPLGGQAGTAATMTVEGWNLPATSLPLDTNPNGPEFRQLLVGKTLGNEVPYVVDDLPSTTEKEGEAQTVPFPSAIDGRIDQPGDLDRFRFMGKAGQEIVAEVLARRLGSPLDSLLRLVADDGTEVALNDDYKDRGMGLVTHQADSYIQAKLPRDGAYEIQLSDTQRQGGPAFAYRLQLRAPQPDFALRLVPSALNLASGRPASCTVHVLRRDGFAGEVNLALADAPEGFRLANGRIAADQESGQVVLSVPRGTPPQVLPIRIEGVATIDGKEVRRPVVPAEDMMQAFLWRFLVPQQELLVSVTGSRPVPTIWQPMVPGASVATAMPLRIPLGGTAQVRISGSQLATARLQIANEPRGIMLREVQTEPTGVVLTLKVDRNIALVGDAANVIVEVATANREPLGVLPAIPFEIVEP